MSMMTQIFLLVVFFALFCFWLGYLIGKSAGYQIGKDENRIVAEKLCSDYGAGAAADWLREQPVQTAMDFEPTHVSMIDGPNGPEYTVAGIMRKKS